MRVTQESDDVNEAIAGELRLMDPAVRSGAEAARLFDPEFVEVGASGRSYTYEETIAGLPDKPGSAADGPRYEPSAITGVLLAPGLVHLTFETVFDGRRARRSSLWRKRDEETGWRMYYHQGTPVPPDID
ncbi:nuclear transport factor 2 family protein [Streptomyces sp. NPDC002088]|uniref:nuclear transport factor 2 family protein n=1 Tax=Streptomyces sp. NPDC002088 TaxID=3154665 RepID=UPI003330E393